MTSSENSIRNLRCRLGVCRSELAHRLGVSSAEITAWEEGNKLPTAEQTDILERLFRQAEGSVLEILQSPHAERALASGNAESVNLNDLAQGRTLRKPL